MQVPLESYNLVKKGNVEELLAYGFHYKWVMPPCRCTHLPHS